MLKGFTKDELLDFKEGQKIMTNMLREFDRICRKYNLSYWCIGGTFIGAIRYNGWIPWDADIDLAILEEDYIRLREIIQLELPKGMWFQDKTTDKYYKYDIGKIRWLESDYKDYKDRSHHNGIQIDLFIFKKTGDTISGEHEHYGLTTQQRSFHYNDIFPLREIMFEDISIFIPNRYEEKCKQVFGGYPIPIPPSEQQYPHEGKISLKAPLWMKEKYKELYDNLYSNL
jgi:phosphorylcholine metabolism protein LicD